MDSTRCRPDSAAYVGNAANLFHFELHVVHALQHAACCCNFTTLYGVSASWPGQAGPELISPATFYMLPQIDSTKIIYLFFCERSLTFVFRGLFNWANSTFHRFHPFLWFLAYCEIDVGCSMKKYPVSPNWPENNILLPFNFGVSVLQKEGKTSFLRCWRVIYY